MKRHTIALSGLSETDAALFEAALGALPDDDWRLVAGPEAGLVVVDVDTVWGHMEWVRARACGGHVAAYTRNPKLRDAELMLTKPLRTRGLADLIARVRESADATGAKAATHTPETTPEPAPRAAAGPTPRAANSPLAAPADASPSAPLTLGECLLKDELIRPMSIQTTDGIFICLDPERGGYTGAAELKPLRALMDMPLEYAEPLQPDTIRQMREEPALPLSRLVWLAALCATPGKLAAHLDPHARYQLARWPHIEREFPRHFRIATAMMKGVATLEAIAEATAAPLAEVIDFVNAYSALGHVVAEDTNDDGDAGSKDENGMFSRLRRSFARAGQKSR